MTLINTEGLLQPVSADAPTGQNLEYDADYMQLERAAQGKPEQQMGGAVIPAEPPDYVAVIKQATALLERTKDLRIASHLVQALLHRAAFGGLEEGLELIHGLLDRYWDQLHPELDPEDGNDPVMRVTALAGLCTGQVLTHLRAAPLIHSRSFGQIGLRELAMASGELPQSEDGPKYEPATVEAGFQEVDLDVLEATAQTLKNAALHLSGIEATFEANAGMRGPDFSPLAQLIRQAISAVDLRLNGRRGVASAEEAPAPIDGEGNGAAQPVRSAVPLTGEIASREDVVRALDKICAYYARHEPSSPLPLLLERCKRLVSMSFMDIVRDIVPDAMSQLELIAGKSSEE
jgi:type VI secretion system protein ImpA